MLLLVSLPLLTPGLKRVVVSGWLELVSLGQLAFTSALGQFG